jgi:hypothetical protein
MLITYPIEIEDEIREHAQSGRQQENCKHNRHPKDKEIVTT